ncbi:hypothetical protein [Streptomyces mesophilus]|uniref:hypothetical protein n=1 Tax=Streptomyces mesophilus TaxID=1775132 RepID=UPI00332EE096
MGLFDKLTGTRRPADGVVARSGGEVCAALLGLNGADVPYVIRDGRGEGADLVAEWRVLDPDWRAFFVRSQVSRVFQVRMRLVPEKREVRSLDQQYEVTWAGDRPRLAIAAEVQRGQVRTVSKRWTLGGDGDVGGDVDGGGDGDRDGGSARGFRFDSAELKTPLQEAVLGAGWTWRGVVTGKL